MKRWLILLVLAPALLWSAYWGVVAFRVQHDLETALRGESFEGLSGQVQESRMRGFPSRFHFGITDLELHQAGIFSTAIPQVQIEAAAYSPHLINLELESPQRVTTAFGDTIIEADLFQIGIFLRPHLSVPLDRAALRLDAAELTTPDQGRFLGIDRLNMMFSETPESQNGDTEGLYRFSLEGTGIDLSDLLPDVPDAYRTISGIRADIGLIYSSLWDSAVFSTGFPRLQNVIIPEARLTLGPSEISLRGQVSVGAQGALTGDVILDITAWRGFLAALTQAGILDQDLAEVILQIMGGQDDGDTITLPLRIENNLVSFGVFTLGFLPMP